MEHAFPMVPGKNRDFHSQLLLLRFLAFLESGQGAGKSRALEFWNS